jgi:hypothetical protein
MKSLKTLSFFVAATMLIVGCSKHTSETTGWNYNDSKWEVLKYPKIQNK